MEGFYWISWILYIEHLILDYFLKDFLEATWKVVDLIFAEDKSSDSSDFFLFQEVEDSSSGVDCAPTWLYSSKFSSRGICVGIEI